MSQCKPPRSTKKTLVDVGVRRWRVVAPAASLGSAKAATHRVVPWNQLTLGTLVWARVPFEDVDDYKIRPCVALARIGGSLVVMPCTTSQNRHKGEPHVELRHPHAAGLSRAGAVRRRTLTLEHADVLSVIGQLRDEDLAAVAPGAANRAAVERIRIGQTTS